MTESGPGERPLYGGRSRVRPSIALDGGTAGTWTVRAGWTIGPRARPADNCADSFAVWCQGPWLYVVVAAGRASPAGAAVAATALGVTQFIDLAHAMPGASAHLLMSEQRKLYDRSPLVREFDGLDLASFAVGVFPYRVPSYGRGIATLAASGPGVGAWILGTDGSPASVLAAASPVPQAVEGLEVLDGDIVCIASSALARRPAGDQFRLLWPETPGEPAFLQFLLGATGQDPDGAALVAMWSGRYEVAPA